ncbi:hypothetical protein GLOIN_2v1841250 [Rhizophagus clarus]|uniref:Ion transport domain-containing protein n=1 Tax=Rhizophagus clarus TaxID=94130 RepID=A0A8H3LEL7_9GLOM|nr:hypothetical protein GLOIN_2v1841250 [Rhizophagus clarus]
MDQQSEHITIIISEKIVPHNGKSITKISVSPQSKYIVTYSQEDKSFVGWHINEEDKSFKNYTRWFINDDEEDESFIGCTKSLVRWFMFTKDRKSFLEFIKWACGAIQEDRSNDNNDDDDDSGPLIFDDKVQSYKLLDLRILDFKVSDKKIIMYEDNNGSAIIYDMKSGKEITLNLGFKKYADDKYKYDIPHYKFTNFLTNGDLATYNIIENEGCKKPVIIIYTFKNNNWICKSIYELDKMNIDFGGITNDALWMLSSNTIFILDLFTFQYQKVLLKVDVDIKMIKLKFFKSLMVISIDDTHYIYSNRISFLIKSITETDLKSSIICNNLLKFFFEIDDNSGYSDIRFIFNDQKVFGVFYEKPWIINIKLCDLEAYILKDNSINDIDSQDLISENIFCCIENQLVASIEDVDEFITDYVTPNLVNLNEKQNGYYTRLKRSKDEIFLETFVLNNINSSQNVIGFSCNVELWSKNMKYINIDNSTYIFYDEIELHIYTFNMKSKKIKPQSYDIKFLKYAMKLYNEIKLDTLEVEEIKELARPTDNDELKKQWVLYAIGQKYFLVNYGENLLKSAIKQNNIELVESIYNKILEYFKEDPKNNIYILSILCKNMPYLNQNYSEFLSKYYNEMNLFPDSSNSSMIHNDLPHLYSSCNELKITKITFIYHFFHVLYLIYFYSLYSIQKLFSKLLKFLKYFKTTSLLLNLLILQFLFIFGVATIGINRAIGSIITIIVVILFSINWRSHSLLILICIAGITVFRNTTNYIMDVFYWGLYGISYSCPFSRTQNNELYKTWNGEAIINFKWRLFGRYYYAGIWILFIIYLICFTLASFPSDIFNKAVRKKLFFFSIVLGSIHLSFEVRQFIWSPIRWIFDIRKLFDLSTYLVPILTSICWTINYINGESKEYTKAISISCLLLDIKFLLFFRAFESFGIYFAIIISVAKRIISFLFIILIIVLGFAHAFFILLEPKSNISESKQGNLNDPNNPWLLTKKYHQITEDGNITPNATLIEEPDSNTNLFSNYPNSLFSMYLFLTGDRNSLSAWSPKENPLMIMLMITFSLVVVVYLMNLLIGLLNMAIETDNDRASYLAQKALILREIELFYLLPHQRRWKTWFPDIIYYYANVDKTRQTIKKLKNEGTWKTNGFPEMRENLSKLAFGN